MVNNNYVNGRAKEYRVCNKLKEEDYDIVQRTAGSHSPFDVIAINKDTREIHLVQVKPTNSKEIEKIEQDNLDLIGEFKVVFEVR